MVTQQNQSLETQAFNFNHIESRYPQAHKIRYQAGLLGTVVEVTLPEQLVPLNPTNLQLAAISQRQLDNIIANSLPKQVVVKIQRLEQPTVESRKYSHPLWQIQIQFQDNSTLYIAASNGKILAYRGELSQWFDLFWMLHIMDYTERSNFNNALVIFCAAMASLFALTGLLMNYQLLKRTTKQKTRPSPG